MKKRIKSALHYLLGNRLLKIIEADNTYVYGQISLTIPPGVFHPHYFTSSKLLIQFIESNQVKNKSILELGCGSAITSFVASKKGADATASDISHQVVNNVVLNQKNNEIVFKSICSDLFDDIPLIHFDYILVNPPFYAKNPVLEKEHAWYCGQDFEFFKKLFLQLNERGIKKCIYMTLSSDCELAKIKNIALEFKYSFHIIKTKKSISEENYLFEIRQNQN